jgi:hypothetical protein
MMAVTAAKERPYVREYDMETYIGEYCSYFSKTKFKSLSTTRETL